MLVTMGLWDLHPQAPSHSKATDIHLPEPPTVGPTLVPFLEHTRSACLWGPSLAHLSSLQKTRPHDPLQPFPAEVSRGRKRRESEGSLRLPFPSTPRAEANPGAERLRE